MSWREAESLLCSINQPLNAAKEPFIHLTVSLSILKSFDLDCSLRVCYKITEASILSADGNKNTVSCIVTQGLTYASRSERSSLAGLVHGLNQWEA